MGSNIFWICMVDEVCRGDDIEEYTGILPHVTRIDQ